MARTGVRLRLLLKLRRECELASSRGAQVRSAEISLLRLVQVRLQQSPAIGALTQRPTPATTGRQQYRCDRFRRLQGPTMGSRRTPKLSAPLAGYTAGHRARREQLRIRKPQMLLSVQTWTPESRLRREKKAVHLPDMGSVDAGCSSCGFPRYATP